MSKRKTLVMAEDWFGHEEHNKNTEDEELIHGDQEFEVLDDELGSLSDYEYCETSPRLKKDKTSKLRTYECKPEVSIIESISLMIGEDKKKEGDESKNAATDLTEAQTDIFRRVPVITHEAPSDPETEPVLTEYDTDSSDSVIVIGNPDTDNEDIANLSDVESIADYISRTSIL